MASLSRSELPRLYLRGEHGGTCPDAPADHGLGEAALLDAPADLVFLSAPYLPRNREREKARKLVEPTAAGKAPPNPAGVRGTSSPELQLG